MTLRAGVTTACILVALWASPPARASEGPVEPNSFFYQGNTLYASQHYVDALSAYEKVLSAGLESANLYYNIGNGFFKMAKYGYAILCYERARRISPGDSDIRSNLAYARTLTGELSFAEAADPAALKAFKRPFRDLGLDHLIVLSFALYMGTVLLVAFHIVNPVAAKKIRIVTACAVIAAAYTMTACGLRYHAEVMQRYGIVLVKEAECRFEPIDKSAGYFKVREGTEVLVIGASGDWRQIRRADGKAGWVKADAVDVI